MKWQKKHEAWSHEIMKSISNKEKGQLIALLKNIKSN